MRYSKLILSLFVLFTLADCSAPERGHYDANGMWVPASNATTEAQRIHSPDSASMTPPNYEYDNNGYYHSRKYYSGADNGYAFSVPMDYLPPRGMCRVWFMNRTPEHQPSIESCEGIHSRMPAGAYVIYGG